MNKQIAELLTEHDEELEIREGYSGRGMFGRETTAIVAPDVNHFMSTLFDCMTDPDFLEELHWQMEDGTIDRADISQQGLRSDDMGLQVVIY